MAWRSMFDFFIGTAPTRTHSLGKRGLTPNDSRALMTLDGEAGRTMGPWRGSGNAVVIQ